jgi:hypothetical protein
MSTSGIRRQDLRPQQTPASSQSNTAPQARRAGRATGETRAAAIDETYATRTRAEVAELNHATHTPNRGRAGYKPRMRTLAVLGAVGLQIYAAYLNKTRDARRMADFNRDFGQPRFGITTYPVDNLPKTITAQDKPLPKTYPMTLEYYFKYGASANSRFAPAISDIADRALYQFLGDFGAAIPGKKPKKIRVSYHEMPSNLQAGDGATEAQIELLPPPYLRFLCIRPFAYIHRAKSYCINGIHYHPGNLEVWPQIIQINSRDHGVKPDQHFENVLRHELIHFFTAPEFFKEANKRSKQLLSEPYAVREEFIETIAIALEMQSRNPASKSTIYTGQKYKTKLLKNKNGQAASWNELAHHLIDKLSLPTIIQSAFNGSHTEARQQVFDYYFDHLRKH